MRTTGAEALQPVLKFLDWLIAEHGDFVYMGLVYASIPLIVWILGGGLRRRQPRRDSTRGISIIVIRPPARPPPLPPPIIGSERDSLADDERGIPLPPKKRRARADSPSARATLVRNQSVATVNFRASAPGCNGSSSSDAS